ncbi:MAG: putative transposase [Micromonosporaceae bacterium]|jgi:putative transposase|nr:putative transposase [Micromonosporaceae bacterium]
MPVLHGSRLTGGLARVKANLGQWDAERSYGVAEDDLTPSFGWSMYSMRKAWNQAKMSVAPWWAHRSKEAYATGLDCLARALSNWSDSQRGKRKGPRIGFPRFNPSAVLCPPCGSPPG